MPQVSDQLAYLCGDGRLSWLATLAETSLVIAEALLVPGDHSAGLDKGQGVLPAETKTDYFLVLPRQPIGPRKGIGKRLCGTAAVPVELRIESPVGFGILLGTR
jgi:hypothetical protein